MKKSLLLFCAFLVLSACSGDDDNSQTNSISYSPPNWIQGSWGIAASEGVNETVLYKFKSNDFCQVTSTVEMCWTDMLENAVGASSNETETDTQYDVSSTVSGATTTLRFQKISATKILWVTTPQSYELVKLD